MDSMLDNKSVVIHRGNMFTKNDINNLITIINDGNIKGKNSEYIIALKIKLYSIQDIKLPKKYYTDLEQNKKIVMEQISREADS